MALAATSRRIQKGTGRAHSAGREVSNALPGTSLVTCVNGKVARDDCARVHENLTCVSGEHGISCEGTGTECTHDDAETRSDGVIGFCMWGSKAALDCKEYGLSGCTTRQTSTNTYASCTF